MPAIERTFDYLVRERDGDHIRAGSVVRIDLHGRRVGGWVEAVDVEPPPGVDLRAVAKVSGFGPSPEIIDLARWAAWRWAGALPAILRTASPERVVTSIPLPRAIAPIAVSDGPAADLTIEALDAGGGVVQLPPGADRSGALVAAAARGNCLVVAPTWPQAHGAADRLRRAGARVATYPDDWALAAAGACVVGPRAAVWAPVGDLAAIVVLDEHDESLQQEQTPTWHARAVAIERARRAGVPCVLLSPCPSLEARRWAPVAELSRNAEREGWPVVQVADRRASDPREGLWGIELVRALREPGRRAVCVLNRTGRASLLACVACGETATCERCGAAVRQPEQGTLVCGRCSASRPQTCLACDGIKMRALRVGVTRARDELEALLGEPVAEITGTSPSNEEPDARVVIGTEAVLHQIPRADIVAFVEMDQELLAARYRAAEESLALLARAARMVGGRRRDGRIVVQTRVPEHEALRAAVHSDPTTFAEDEMVRRDVLGFPPATAMAVVSGASAPAFIDALGAPLGVEVMGPADDRWLLRALDHATLCDALAATPRPAGRLRIEVDPLRV